MISKIKISEIKKLLQKKYREEEKKFIVEGWKSVEEAISANAEIETIVYDSVNFTDNSIISKLHHSAKEVLSATAKEIQSISDAVTPQGIIAVVSNLKSSSSIENILKRKTALFIAVEEMNDPGNLGTIIRTCDWFGVDALVVGKKSVDLYNAKVVRATMGSLFHFPIFTDIDLLKFIAQSRKEDFRVFTTELSKSEDIRNISFAKKSVIVIGSESHGVSKEISLNADEKIFIPQFGKAESLNAAMACGVILSHIKLQHT